MVLRLDVRGHGLGFAAKRLAIPALLPIAAVTFLAREEGLVLPLAVLVIGHPQVSTRQQAPGWVSGKTTRATSTPDGARP